ncbi:MAG: 30S ribosomal protein S6, partial [Proteobacteria bacterium]|nr:30S ribosomal protein S6 [Pseudomonadota bacterium]
MRRYETIIIIDPDLSDDGRKPIIEKIKEVIEQQKGILVVLDEWGSRRLAYEIKSKTRGYYVRFDFCGMGPLVDEIERFSRIEDGVLKYMTVVLNKDVDEDALQTEIAEIQSKAEAAAKEA